MRWVIDDWANFGQQPTKLITVVCGSLIKSVVCGSLIKSKKYLRGKIIKLNNLFLLKKYLTSFT